MGWLISRGRYCWGGAFSGWKFSLYRFARRFETHLRFCFGGFVLHCCTRLGVKLRELLSSVRRTCVPGMSTLTSDEERNPAAYGQSDMVLAARPSATQKRNEHF